MNYHISDAFSNLAPSAIREILKYSSAYPDIIAFSAGNPAPESFPREEMAKIAAGIFEHDAVAALQYGTSEGYLPLREALCNRLSAKKGISLEKNSLVITSGGQQALELACRVLCSPGDTVLCEDPTFIGALNAFRAAGAHTVGVAMDKDGMDPEALERALNRHKRARMIYLIPNFQNPRGSCTSYERRRALYEIAVKHGVVILEDDPYGEIRFSGADIPPIKSFDTEDCRAVIYCSSFSKLLSAGMRVGYALAPEEIAAKMVVGKQCEDVHTNMFFQMLCHRFMTEYDFEAHLERVRGIYRHKAGVMQEALRRYMPTGALKYTNPEGGLFVFCELLGETDPDVFLRTALQRKVAVVPGQVFSPGNDTCFKCFRMSYATASDEQIDRGVRILSESIVPVL